MVLLFYKVFFFLRYFARNIEKTQRISSFSRLPIFRDEMPEKEKQNGTGMPILILFW